LKKLTFWLETVFEKTQVRIKKITPNKYLDGLTAPLMILIGDKDEMIKMKEIKTMFSGAKSNVKRLRVIRGGHSTDRDSKIIS
jgi:esterase/lipase